jgi:hypothetical protein
LLGDGTESIKQSSAGFAPKLMQMINFNPNAAENSAAERT